VASPTKEQIADLWKVHTSPEAEAARQFRSDIFDPRRRWAKKDGYYRLSDRLWQGSKDVRRQINEVLKEAIRTGEDSLIVATKLEQFLDPSFSPVRLKSGRYKPNQRKAILTRSPGRAGYGSTSTRRLARTELSRVHAEATLYSVAHTPFSVGVRWALSGRHPKADECSVNAEQDSGLGRGVYRVEDAPRMPSHPNCLCHFQPVVESDTDKIVADLRKLYRLDES
jgi:hypothetical protein